ncbi:MAG: flavodoxin family protein [Methanotrichaceae archaeon]
MMKILGINGSPRGSQSQTLKLVESVLDGAKKAGAEIELVDLCKLKINYCDACGVCYKTGKCIHEDDFNELYEKILNSDGLVLGSPVYFRSVTAQLKTLIDRMSDVMHCQLLNGKYGCAVSTAGSEGHEEVAEYINGILTGMGANAVGIAGAAMSVPNTIEKAKKDAFKLGQTLEKAIEIKPTYPEQEEVHKMIRERFGKLVERNKDEWSHQYEYWISMGWLDK